MIAGTRRDPTHWRALAALILNVVEPQSISSAKISGTTRQRDTTHAEIKTLHLPFPKKARVTLATNIEKAMRPTNFQIPGDGDIPCGLPPL